VVTYLVGVVGSGGSTLALLARGELGEIAVVVTLPVVMALGYVAHTTTKSRPAEGGNLHLVVEDLGLAGGGMGNQGVVQDIKDVLANLLKLGLDLVAVVADGGNVLVGTLSLLLLLDGGDDSPGCTSGADNILVGNGQQVALINGELTTQLGNLLHVGDHLIVALSLLAESGKEGLAIKGEKNQACQLWPSRRGIRILTGSKLTSRARRVGSRLAKGSFMFATSRSSSRSYTG